jgi:hypothetical protein
MVCFKGPSMDPNFDFSPSFFDINGSVCYFFDIMGYIPSDLSVLSFLLALQMTKSLTGRKCI